MIYRPHDYQKFVINFILEHPIAAIFLDMGMGKSSITLTAIMELMYDRFEVSKVLIVAPLRVCKYTWPQEIVKWEHLSGLKFSLATGTAAERKMAFKADADIYIINRENIPWQKSGDTGYGAENDHI